MISKAPRQTAGPWHHLARGARLLLSFWLAGSVPVAMADTLTSARFTEPTTRYAHGVLGDNIEYGALELTVSRSSSGSTERESAVVTIRLPTDRVFEDLAPRLVDLDLDGSPEVIVVEAQKDTGAQLAVYDALGQKITATPHIGTRFRWLAPVGAADLDGDGHIEIAYVDRPHLAKTLRIWRFEDGMLTEIATLPGLTNHRIGEDFITGGLRDCGSGPDLILADANWRNIVRVQYADGWVQTDLGPFTKAALERYLTCSG